MIRAYRSNLLSHLASTLAFPDVEFAKEMVKELRAGLKGGSGGVSESMFKGFVAVVGRCLGKEEGGGVRTDMLALLGEYDLKHNLVKPLVQTCLEGKGTFDEVDEDITGAWVGRVEEWWKGGGGEWREDSKETLEKSSESPGGGPVARFVTAESWGALGVCYLHHLPSVIRSPSALRFLGAALGYVDEEGCGVVGNMVGGGGMVKLAKAVGAWAEEWKKMAKVEGGGKKGKKKGGGGEG